LQLKYDSIIEALSKKANISLREAMDIFYKSPIYEEISKGAIFVKLAQASGALDPHAGHAH